MKVQLQRLLMLAVLLMLVVPVAAPGPGDVAAAPVDLASESMGTTQPQPFVSTAVAAPWTWNITAVDTIGNVGEYASLALDNSQYPWISYYGSGNLKLAKWDGTAWVLQILDSAGDTGLWTSLATFGVTGSAISYYNATYGDLKFTRDLGSETVDSTGDVGRYSSLVTDGVQGWPVHIAYYDGTNGDLKYAKGDGLTWNIHTVDAVGDVGRWPSIALQQPSGRPAIAYYDVTNGDLKYAFYDVEGFWVMETVITESDIGQWPSLAFDSQGGTHIVFSLIGGGNLRYSYRPDPGSAWVHTFVTTDVLGPASLRLDSNDTLHVAYWTAAGLEYARQVPTGTGNCGPNDTWYCEVVDPGGLDVGNFPSLRLDSNDRPHIAYRDDYNMDLKYAVGCVGVGITHDADPVCVGSIAHFTSTVFGDPALSYLWDFGDGSTSALPNPAHVYSEPGRYTVTLTVTASCGVAVATAVAEAWGAPEAGYTYEPQPVCVSVPVSFTNTTVGSGTLSFNWNFGDGGSSMEKDPLYTFINPGIYTVMLLAQNECGFDLHSENVQAHVGPLVGMSWEPDPAEVHQVVTFTAQTTSTLPVDLTWEFDDGTVATGPTVTRVYDVVGTYPVTLTGVSGCGVDQVVKDVLVVCYPPTDTNFTWLPLTPTVGFPVVFEAEASGSTPFEFSWSFGDGGTASGQIVSHTYATSDHYTVTLTVENDCGEEQVAHTLYVSMPPIAAFSSNAPVCLGDPVVFTNESGGVPPLFYYWSFGDGNVSTQEHPTHTYALANTYLVSLTVTSTYGLDEVAHPVEVLTPANNASFTVQPLHPEPGEQVTFVGSAQGASPLEYAWDFGDGSTGSGQVVLHTYPVTGNYTVWLTVTNDCGVATVTQTVPVAYCTPPAGLGLSYKPHPPIVGETARYTASLSAGSLPVMYSWTFDDGITTTGKSVQHTFATVGDHAVTVMAVNVCGLTQRTFTVYVSPRIYYVYLPILLRDHFEDIYEPDDTSADAKELVINASPQRRRLDPAGDVDWVYVDLAAGAAYTFETGDLGGTADTVLKMYDTDATTLLAQNDDCTGFVKWSCLTISAPSTGRFYLRVRDYDPAAGGRANTYTLMGRTGTR